MLSIPGGSKKTIVLNLILAIFLILTVYGALNMLQENLAVRKENRELKNKIERLAARKHALEAYLTELGTQEAAEREAKKRLGLKNPGENVVVVLDENIPTGTTSEKSEPHFWNKLILFFKRLLP